MAILGYNTIGATTSGNVTGDGTFGSRFTTTEDGTITDINAYVRINAPGTATMRVAVFAVGAGNTVQATPLATSATAVNVTNTSFAWVSCPISYTFAAGTDLWLFAWVDPSGIPTDYNYAADVNAIANTIMFAWANSYPNWSTVGDGSNEAYDLAYASIYANYTPSTPSSIGVPSFTGVQSFTGIQSVTM